jgi:hypothetical protein
MPSQPKGIPRRLCTPKESDRISIARRRALTATEQAGVNSTCRQYVQVLPHVRGGPKKHCKQLAQIESWAVAGCKQLEALSAAARLASKIDISSGGQTNEDRAHIDWLMTVGAKARSGRQEIGRRGKLHGVLWQDPDVFLIVYVARALGMPLRASVITGRDGGAVADGPLVRVMEEVYKVLHRCQKAGWFPFNNLIKVPSRGSIRARIRKARQVRGRASQKRLD